MNLWRPVRRFHPCREGQYLNTRDIQIRQVPRPPPFNSRTQLLHSLLACKGKRNDAEIFSLRTPLDCNVETECHLRCLEYPSADRLASIPSIKAPPANAHEVPMPYRRHSAYTPCNISHLAKTVQPPDHVREALPQNYREPPLKSFPFPRGARFCEYQRHSTPSGAVNSSQSMPNKVHRSPLCPPP